MNGLLIKSFGFFYDFLSPETALIPVNMNLFGEKFTSKGLDSTQRVVRNFIARSIESFEFFQSPSLPELR